MVPTWMLQVKVSDLSGSMYINFARELGDSIMAGISAREFQDMKERISSEGGDSTEAVRQWVNENVNFKTHQILVKAGNDTYKGADGETRLKFYAVKVYSQ